MAYLVAKTTIEESTGLVSTTAAGHMALHNDKAKAVNSLTEEVIDARNPALATPEATATSVPDLLGQLKEMLKNITGETNWFDGVANTLSGMFNDIAALVARFPVVTGDITDGAVTRDKILKGAPVSLVEEDFSVADWNATNKVIAFTPAQASDYTAMFIEFATDVTSDVCNVGFYTTNDGSGSPFTSMSAPKGAYINPTIYPMHALIHTIMLPTTIRSAKITSVGGANIISNRTPNIRIRAYFR